MELPNHRADVAELADALDSGSSARKGVGVRVLFSALTLTGNSLTPLLTVGKNLGKELIPIAAANTLTAASRFSFDK